MGQRTAVVPQDCNGPEDLPSGSAAAAILTAQRYAILLVCDAGASKRAAKPVLRVQYTTLDHGHRHLVFVVTGLYFLPVF